MTRRYLQVAVLLLLPMNIAVAEDSGTISLFNGKDLTGWHVDVPEMDKDPNAKNPFIVRDGMLVSLGTPGGHLITDKEYKNYRLEIDYRFVDKPGNCGVLVHASKPRALYDMFPQSLEVQMASGDAGDFWCIREDITVPDMEVRRSPSECVFIDDRALNVERAAELGINAIQFLSPTQLTADLAALGVTI